MIGDHFIAGYIYTQVLFIVENIRSMLAMTVKKTTHTDLWSKIYSYFQLINIITSSFVPKEIYKIYEVSIRVSCKIEYTYKILICHNFTQKAWYTSIINAHFLIMK